MHSTFLALLPIGLLTLSAVVAIAYLFPQTPSQD